jgi:hypothetical protein
LNFLLSLLATSILLVETPGLQGKKLLNTAPASLSVSTYMPPLAEGFVLPGPAGGTATGNGVPAVKANLAPDFSGYTPPEGPPGSNVPLESVAGYRSTVAMLLAQLNMQLHKLFTSEEVKEIATRMRSLPPGSHNIDVITQFLIKKGLASVKPDGTLDISSL